ncbi:hypothetical protein NDU88_000702 [Pleurodeles waltl]|uniref:Uncharacterized protein n=1 Tax=Pleurodeles waltl TaxID=8319 RepID=A0AAV7MHL9_PLEWA|nr:hypothetical protein NDU88_000702 [Pleurodeles waltl]
MGPCPRRIVEKLYLFRDCIVRIRQALLPSISQRSARAHSAEEALGAKGDPNFVRAPRHNGKAGWGKRAQRILCC